MSKRQGRIRSWTFPNQGVENDRVLLWVSSRAAQTARELVVEVPSPKTQIPGKVSKYPNSKGRHQLLWELKRWDFLGIWCLGSWDFHRGVPRRASPASG